MYNTTTGPSQHQVSYTNLTTSVPAVPVDRYVTGAAPPLGERELRRLEKQAAKHNRKSEKDLRKAEQRMQKAEKMHQKGRDDKAMKLEQKAQHLMQLADHERKWASGLQGEVAHNAPAPASM
jgi:NADH:ubiquinone oxidoreductase subunit B-like Fe-S oxidoreductase